MNLLNVKPASPGKCIVTLEQSLYDLSSRLSAIQDYCRQTDQWVVDRPGRPVPRQLQIATAVINQGQVKVKL